MAHENIIVALAPLLENNHPTQEICDFFSKVRSKVWVSFCYQKTQGSVTFCIPLISWHVAWIFEELGGLLPYSCRIIFNIIHLNVIFDKVYLEFIFEAVHLNHNTCLGFKLMFDLKNKICDCEFPTRKLL